MEPIVQQAPQINNNIQQNVPNQPNQNQANKVNNPNQFQGQKQNVETHNTQNPTNVIPKNNYPNSIPNPPSYDPLNIYKNPNLHQNIGHVPATNTNQQMKNPANVQNPVFQSHASNQQYNTPPQQKISQNQRLPQVQFQANQQFDPYQQDISSFRQNNFSPQKTTKNHIEKISKSQPNAKRILNQKAFRQRVRMRGMPRRPANYIRPRMNYQGYPNNNYGYPRMPYIPQMMGYGGGVMMNQPYYYPQYEMPYSPNNYYSYPYQQFNAKPAQRRMHHENSMPITDLDKINHPIVEDPDIFDEIVYDTISHRNQAGSGPYGDEHLDDMFDDGVDEVGIDDFNGLEEMIKSPKIKRKRRTKIKRNSKSKRRRMQMYK